MKVTEPNELIATKIRALYQRSKGRDLFDLWLALTELNLSSARILEAFGPYRPPGLTALVAENALRAKLLDPSFRDDVNPLVRSLPGEYEPNLAAELVIAELLARL